MRHAEHPPASSAAGRRLRVPLPLLAAALAVLFVFSGPTIASASQWSEAGSLTDARVRSHTATLLENGKVLVVGGTDRNGAPLATAELYDPASNSWATTGSLATARADHTATPLGDGTVLVAGGRGTGGRLGTAELYDPATGAWTVNPAQMSEASYDQTATLLSSAVAESGPLDAGKVLLAGGCCNASGGSLFGSELYAPTTKDWTDTGIGFTYSHRGHTATLLSASNPAQCGSRCGMVLAVGGRGGASPLDNGKVPPEIYDPRSQRWTLTSDQMVRRWAHTATLLADGRVLIAGGTGTGSSPALNGAELFDPVTGFFELTGSLITARTEHAAVRLPGGKTLVVGGRVADGGSALTSAELYSPGLRSWTAVDSMATARAGAGDSEGPTATLLKDGRVLVVGGSDAKTAELYSELPSPPEDGGGSGAGDPPAGVAPGTGGPQGGGGGGQGGDGVALVGSERARARGMARCMRAVARRSALRSLRRGSRAYRRAVRLRRAGRRRCVRRFGRTPGRVRGLGASAASKTKVVLSFRAPGTDRARPPAARGYLVKQSRRPIRGRAGFRRAQTLCKGSCRFAVTEVGSRIELTVTGLRPNTTYFYAIAARDNVSRRLGPRSPVVKVRTR